MARNLNVVRGINDERGIPGTAIRAMDGRIEVERYQRTVADKQILMVVDNDEQRENSERVTQNDGDKKRSTSD